MARLNYLSSGYSIIDEVVNRSSATALRIGHDLVKATGFELWTGLGKTGTKLTLTTDYVLSEEASDYTTKVGSTIYTKLAIVNGAYLNTLLYCTYTTVGDSSSVENVESIGLDAINQSNFPTMVSISDTDEVLGFNSGSSFSKIRMTWTNIKSFLKTYFDSLYGKFSTSTHYTPTVTNVTNCSSLTAHVNQVTRVDDTVIVSGYVAVTATASGSPMSFIMTLPYASDFASAWQCGGTSLSDSTQHGFAIFADPTNNAARFYKLLAEDTSSHDNTFMFHYTII